VAKFRETTMPRLTNQDLALPTLYLHFLDNAFFLNEGERNNNLRGGNDNSEIQLVLPVELLPSRETVSKDWRSSFDLVVNFLRSQCEVMSSPVVVKPGAFGPKQKFEVVSTNTRRLLFSLKTQRPKAPVNLDKDAFGIPDEAELYLFAENHVSVNHMSKEDIDAFEKCIENALCADSEVARFGVFIKVFYEGGFAYNQKIASGEKGYLPKNVGLACMSTVPAKEGQVGMSTGFPYLVESRFLSFVDTVPVTIRAIANMSPQHARYGLCFTRCIFVWESDALASEGVLNFCSILPNGGFYYTPHTLRDHWKLGGLVYPFGVGAKGMLDLPVEFR
jgi:hypothetical protein